MVQVARSLKRSLRRVMKERDHAREEFGTDAVHELRVALRRARSLAEDFSELDSDAEWEHLRKACKELQHSLAQLRDVQVVAELARRLRFPEEKKGEALQRLLGEEEESSRQAAQKALKDFSRKRWRKWRRELPERAETLPFGEAQFALIARRRLDDVDRLERRRRRGPSRTAYHRVRVALRRYRYTVDSFLPETPGLGRYKVVDLQRVLGEIHDLDVLRSKIQNLSRRKELARETRNQRLGAIDRSRNRLASEYRRLSFLGTVEAGKRNVRSKPKFIWDGWRRSLDHIIDVSVRQSEGTLRSQPKAGSPKAAKPTSNPGRRRRLSSRK